MKNSSRLKMEEEWKQRWNIYKENEFDADKLNRLHETYQIVKDENEGIDDITWSDMEMNAFFSEVNYTKTSMGETMLYRLLRNPITKLEDFCERNSMISFFYEKEDARISKQIALSNVGKVNDTSIYEFKSMLETMRLFSVFPHYLYPVLIIISLVMLVINWKIGLPVFLIALIMDVQSYYKDKAKIEYYIPAMFQFGKMMKSITGLNEETGYDAVDNYIRNISEGKEVAKRYNRYMQKIRITVGGKVSVMDDVAEYARVVLHEDLKSYIKLVELIKKNYDLIVKCYETVGYIDCLIAITECKRMFELKFDNVEQICVPQFSAHDNRQIQIERMYHPLLENAVPNSLNTNKSILITGSNATGKSTFLRTLGINVIAAQTLCFAMCKKYEAPFFCVMSSMSLKDNLFLQESYYVTEIKSIKRIINAVNGDLPVLCCLDEVLRGTNTIERISAAAEILRSLAQSNAFCIAASHDSELTYILEEIYDNYHFQEQVSENGLSSDFILYRDRSHTRNAIRLLKYMGYSDEIVENAIQRVEQFLETGKWKI